ncbi:hypothetical protein PVAND_013062 [Polypedilum vanderplanki]|uniref:Uncharacterized protein n=1 Tax=Polypedilum vanderplanki TaxID=319348 RepID=A0A9J6CQB6_POLVA|nr:hypothetical protein PVAND_013062 [Polypedilum vanderplanki]
MKLTILLLAFVVLVAAEDGPTKISDNNMGDIINVGVNAKAKVESKIDATIVKLLLEFLNHQKIQINGPGNGGNGNYPTLPPIEIPTPPPIPN